MTIPQKYRKTSEALVNYDFTDLLEGVGYVTFYGISDEADSTALSRYPLESTDVLLKQTGQPDADLEINFDYPFGFAQVVKGNLYATCTIEAKNTAGETVINTTKIRIYHVRNGTETTIGTQQTIAALTAAGGGATFDYRTTLTFDVDKSFKKGDTLRVEVIVGHNATGTAGANDWSGIYCDGANRDFSITDQHGIAANSNLIVQVPFDLGGII